VAHVTTSDISLRLLLLHQLESIRDGGYDVTGISSPGPDVAALVEAGIAHIAVPMSRRYTPVADLRSLFALWRVLRREGFDVVHTHTPKAGLLGQYAALLAGVPVRVHTIHGLYFPANASPHLRFAFVLLERLTMLFSRHNFCQNPEDMDAAVAEHISRPDRLELIGNGIDLRALAPDRRTADQRRATRRSLGLDDEHLVVGVVARLVAEKGYHELFEAAATVHAAEPRARFVFIGPFEPEKPDAIKQETLVERKIDGFAQFLGHRNDVADLYAVMDLHVLPSHREGFPRTPMEASAMGVPSIVTDVRGCRQTVDHEVTGLIVPVRDPRSLAAAILRLLGDPATRRRMGEAAREKAVREFDERAVFAKVRAAYGRLLEEAGLAGAEAEPSRARSSNGVELPT
jgi:glycosyltransferase involved in cell wall biosynthesis